MFKIITGSRSGHCCFNWSVVDTTQPTMFGPHYYRDRQTGEMQYEAVCECYHEDDAKMIVDALNVAFGFGEGKTSANDTRARQV
jgi:hypothetical protein